MALSAPAQRRTVLLLAAASLACAPAPRIGDDVDIAEESAFIIWDEAAKTQHFIRRASFRTSAKDFGFLVPTPSVPELAEADDKAFDLLEKITAPRVVVQRIPADAKSEAPRPAAVAAAVTVLATAKVAGYDAVVLEATDASALNEWLKKHDYASSPELVDWFKPYLERKWKISAFKIDRDAQRGNSAESGTVRMSFRAEAPFFPYREPETKGKRQSLDPRMLRVYLLSTSRVEGVLGNSGAWPGRAVWSDRIGEPDRSRLFELAKLQASIAASALWLTEFQDGSSPRPGRDDLFFRTAVDQSPMHRPDRIVYEQAMGSMGGGGFIGLVVSVGLFLGFLYVLWKLAAFAYRKLRS